MKRITQLTLTVLFAVLFFQAATAKVKLPAIVSSNMVLQRNTTVVLWGWADANQQLNIDASWLTTPLQVTADNEGNWRVEVKTNNSTDPQLIKISSSDTNITLDNVVFGEVWLCSGQSNMQQSLDGYAGQPTFGANKAIAHAANPNLRLFTAKRKGAKTPLADLEEYTGWEQAHPGNVRSFSAIAYFFGQQLQEILDVPVGMIHTSWGGSSVQAWISKEAISDYQQVDLDELDISKTTNRIPTALYNAMIHPLIPYTIKGALWYQGESNREEPDKYTQLFPVMVKDWRTRWEIGDFPFYYVQIAPYWYNDHEAFNSYKNTAFLRESQLKSAELIPNSGMAVTLDIGSEYCIHPPQKQEVADRLLYFALNQTYGYETVDCNGPVFDSKEEKDGGLLLHFKHAEMGLFTPTQLEGFEIAGPDKVFYPAQAKIAGRKSILVSSDQVPTPVEVRYGWSNWLVGTLFDTNMLPASSFRTDNWNDATRAEMQEASN